MLHFPNKPGTSLKKTKQFIYKYYQPREFSYLQHSTCFLHLKITDKSVESDSSNSQVILDHTVYGCIYVTPVSKQATYFQKKLFSYYD